VYEVLTFLVLPPGGLLLAAFFFHVFGHGGRRAWAITLACLVLLYGFSTPLVADALMQPLQTAAMLPAEGPLPATGELPGEAAGAIVVLGADAVEAMEYGTPTVGQMTLVRLRYAAWLHHRTALPVLATGGAVRPADTPLGELMRRALEEEFGVHPVWVEDRALDTWQNAANSAHILADHGVRRVYLVTAAWHMPRAALAFRRAGVAFIPAPTAWHTSSPASLWLLLPTARSMHDSFFAMHEWVGLAYYAVFRAGSGG
jgi:uncharacterized SAM-binding protein YcdF (DUF218 family)